MTNQEISKILIAIDKQVDFVDYVLSRYTDDEAGESQKDKYNKMTTIDKINILSNTIHNCDRYEDLEIDLVINFDMGNY